MPFRMKIVKGISFTLNSNFNLAIFHINFPFFQTQGIARSTFIQVSYFFLSSLFGSMLPSAFHRMQLVLQAA